MKTVNDRADYGYLRGYSMLSPKLKAFAPRLRKIVTDLETIASPVSSEATERMAGEDRNRTARNMDLSFYRGRRLIDEMEDVRQFVGPEAVATLRNWANHPRCRVRVQFEREGKAFLVGVSAMFRIEISEAMEARLGELPRLGWSRLKSAANFPIAAQKKVERL